MFDVWEKEGEVVTFKTVNRISAFLNVTVLFICLVSQNIWLVAGAALIIVLDFLWWIKKFKENNSRG